MMGLGHPRATCYIPLPGNYHQLDPRVQNPSPAVWLRVFSSVTSCGVSSRMMSAEVAELESECLRQSQRGIMEPLDTEP